VNLADELTAERRREVERDGVEFVSFTTAEAEVAADRGEHRSLTVRALLQSSLTGTHHIVCE